MAKNEVVVVPEYDIQAYSNVERLELIKQNLCGESLSPADFTKVKFPSGDVVHFSVPSITGKPLMLESITGVILQRKVVRAYWPGEYSGDNTPPQCSADDALKGTGDPGGYCLSCELAKFGTAEKGGIKTNAQACKQTNVNFIKIAESELPVMFRVPPSSINVMKKFMAQLPVPFSHCIVALELITVQNKGGIKYPELLPRLVAIMTPEEIVAVDAYKASFNSIFDVQQLRASDAVAQEE